VSGPARRFAWVRAIVFDLDGTLADTFDDLAASVNRVRAARGAPPLSTAEVRSHVGRGSRNLVRAVVPAAGEADVDEVLRAFVLDYSRHLADATRPYPGVIETLQVLSRPGGPAMAVLSNKPEAPARATLSALGLERFFLGVFGGDSLPVMKPDPGALLAVLDRLGVAPGEAIMVGDSDIDIRTGRAAGVKVALVATGLADTASLDPDWRIDDLRALVRAPAPAPRRLPVPPSKKR